MLIGAALVKSEDRNVFYKELGLLLGQAFQVQDDLLDIVGTHAKTGKMPFIDMQDGQHTILSQYIFEKGKAEEKEILMSLFGKQLDEHSRKVLSRLFVETGAISYAQKEIEVLISKAHQLVAASDLAVAYKQTMSTFIDMLHHRTS
jgi:geranylgeranyl diphosphate synthase type I